jgi:leucyl-tRNA synthetase
MTNVTYNFARIEPKWQEKWKQIDLARALQSPSKKYYCLVMFAYPSGDIHMGHFRNYIIGDVVARYRLMRGCDILFPFGWDAFGLPAEEAAIKRGRHPREWTLSNIEISRNTLKRAGVIFDWSREVITCLPDYYRWTQWVFLTLYKRGLVKREKSYVNWCPSCKTALANEQVEGGTCERCHSLVSKRELDQWFFKITDYAEKLLTDLDTLPGWSQRVKSMQKNWIGKSEGCEIDFTLQDAGSPTGGTGEKFSVFTTRPDTIYGVTFMAVAPETEFAKRLADRSPNKEEILRYISQALLKPEMERTAVGEKDGVFTGIYAINPLSGDRIQLYIADYVLPSYGTGIVMGVPAHDQRDFLFARKYAVPVKVVINPPGKSLSEETTTEAYVEPGVMVNSGQFSGIKSEEGIAKIIEHLEQTGRGRKKVNYRLRDWLLSRQRYWGAPIPIIHCETCGYVPVPENQLPVLLPESVKDVIPKGRSPLEDLPEFINTVCPSCGRPAKRDPDTLDTFVCSSWYHLRYADPHNTNAPFSKEEVAKWLPIDLYIGGIEHACGHLIYFRFITKVLQDAGYLGFSEPATVLFNHGMVLDKTGEVMSKSAGNVVSPAESMSKYGTDVTRLTMLFAAPSDAEVRWNEEAVSGSVRFISRLYNFIVSNATYLKSETKTHYDPDTLPKPFAEIRRKMHRTIKKVTQEMENSFCFNTAISAIMELFNLFKDASFPTENISAEQAVVREATHNLVKLLAPMAPHLAEELWETLGNKESIFKSVWPQFDEDAAKEEEVEIVIQINGKVRTRITVPADTPQDALEKLALAEPRVQELTRDKIIKKVISVPNRLVNIVT